MKFLTILLTLLTLTGLTALAGCSDHGTDPAMAEEPAQSSGAEDMSAGAEDMPQGEDQEMGAMRPDTEKLRMHIDEHLQLPASRADILAACADTPEFSDAEKLWIEQNLPEGTYETSEAVTAALGL